MAHISPAAGAGLPALPQLPSLMIPMMQALCQKGAMVAVNPGLERAVLVGREGTDLPEPISVERSRIEELHDWGYLVKIRSGKVSLFEITEAGRVMTPRSADMPVGFRSIADIKPQKDHPVRLLARKKGADGSPFLNSDHIAANDILAEDFRLSGFEEHPVGSMTEVVGFDFGVNIDPGVLAAHKRLVGALDILGPDLGDIAMRCCCLGEGLETAERRMGWSARSGKIVLRIALSRLALHYEGSGAAMCGIS